MFLVIQKWNVFMVIQNWMFLGEEEIKAEPDPNSKHEL